jgi:3-oxoisoapionate kinase
MSGLLYVYYGDDFTGSTDVLESLALAGIESVLFLGLPSQKHLEAFPNCRTIGIAGDSRSRTPRWMSANLPKIFERLKAFEAPVAHYKTCSTFDSSPTRGSIGRAMEIGHEIFTPEFIPIVVGAPHLGRYVVFGNLFATAGGKVYRIDQHPTMRCHPVTPMTEADLNKHLAKQTTMHVGLIDVRALNVDAAASLAAEKSAGAQAVLFDGIDDASLIITGKLLWHEAAHRPLFAVGSSGLTESLITEWQSSGITTQSPKHQAMPVDQILVLSGSCSPVTEGQIRWARANGFAAISIDPSKLTNSATTAAAAEAAKKECIEVLAKGRSAILYTALGPLTKGSKPHGEQLGTQLGKLLKSSLSSTSVRRVIICGGDTASHALQQLRLYALTWSASVEPGAPLCRAHSHDPIFRNLELVLKGGQIGGQDFFELVRNGGHTPCR